MRLCITIIYNQPAYSRYWSMAEEEAVVGVLEAVEAVHQVLIEAGHSVARLPLLPPVEHAKTKLLGLKTDLVFNLFEGFGGQPETEASIAYILSDMGITFTGCPATTLETALDKVKVKSILETSGIHTPKGQVLNAESLHTFNLNYPCIVKPCGEDASHGISTQSVVHDLASLERQITKLSQHFGGKALVEEYIDGREFNVTVMGHDEPWVLPVSEIVYTLPPEMPKILTFSSKWEPDSIDFKGSQTVCPSKIDHKLRMNISEVAMKTFKTLNCSGYARVDFRLDPYGVVHVIEVNPNPDISPSAGAPRQARAAGMSYRDFIESIICYTLGGKCYAFEYQADDKTRQAYRDAHFTKCT